MDLPVKFSRMTDTALALRDQELSALNSVAEVIASAGDLETVLLRVLEKTLTLSFLTVQKKGVIFVVDRTNKDKLNMAAQVGLAPELLASEKQIDLSYCLCGKAARTGEAVWSKDSSEDPDHTTRLPDMVRHGHVVIPIKSGDRVLGAMTFYLEPDTEISVSHGRLLHSIAAQLGVAIENRWLAQDLLAKKQWEETFDAMEELVTIHGPDMTIIRANKAAMSALRKNSGDMVGRKCHEVFHGTDEPIQFCPGVETTKTGEPGRSDHDVTIGGADYEVSVYPLKEDNKLQGFVHVAKDITERKRAAELKKAREQLEEMNRLKSEFLANMSHELRTPLNAVIGLSQVLLEQAYGALTPKQAEYLAGINSSGGHLLSLINDILDLSKIEAGKEKLDMADFSAAGTLGSSFILVREKAMKHGIGLVSEIGPEVGRFHGDERRVKQIIYNLLSNAIKFTEPGGKVGIRASQDAAALTVTVWDTGIGIPDDKKDQLFQPFQMIDSSLSKKREGTGLGLVLTKRLTEMHGGTISFESKEGKGTSFTVVLPMSAAPAPSPECRGCGCGPGPLLTERVKGRKVMVVEDNPINMMLAADYLKAGGMDVIQAADGESALEMVLQEMPELILLDIQMPGIDGFEVLARLKEDPAAAAVPVIAMTALAMKGDEERCGQAGFSGYISKPVNLGEMMRKIAMALSGGIR